MTVRNILDYGAVGDDSTDCTAAFQAALNACSSGDRVFVPHGIYRVSKPIRHNKSQVELVGDGRWGSVIKNQAAFAGCVIAMGPVENGVPTTTDLGHGAALDMRQMVMGLPGDSGNVYLNMRESHSMELHGASSLCFEFQMRTPATWAGGWIAGSHGLRFSTDGMHTSWDFKAAGADGLAFQLNVGGTLRRVAVTGLATSTYYHIAANWNGATLQLFVDGVQVDSVAASGTVVQKNYETAYLGTPSQLWPYSSGWMSNNMACIIDSVRVSTSRYTAGFAPPAQGKLASDGSTKYLCNFNENEANFTKAYSAGGTAVWHMAIRPVQPGQELSFSGVSGLQIQASYAGAVHAYRCVNSHVRDIAIPVGRYGVLFRDNCYLSDMSSIYYVASQANAWFGVANMWACGPNKFSDLNFTGSDYGLINGGSCSLDTYYTSGITSFSILATSQTAYQTIYATNLAISDEGNQAVMEGAVGLNGPGQLTMLGSLLQQSQYDAPLIVADDRVQDILIGVGLVSSPGGSSPLVKWKGSAPGSHRIRMLAESYAYLGGHAMCDVAGVVRQGADLDWIATLRDANT